MLLPHGTVFAIVDGENFELYRNSGPEAEPRLTSMDPPDLEATNFSAGFRRQDGQTRHQARTGDGSRDALDEAAHVAAVTGWLNQQVLAKEIDQLVVAPTHAHWERCVDTITSSSRTYWSAKCPRP